MQKWDEEGCGKGSIFSSISIVRQSLACRVKNTPNAGLLLGSILNYLIFLNET